MTYPDATADTVIVQHRWWDANTRRGTAADITWTPLVAGTSSTTPNLIDSAARGWIKTRTWVSRPDPWSGYLAVPLVATDDPDLTSLTGFGGYRVSADGEAPFTVAVPADVEVTEATAEMCRALAQLDPPFELAPGDPVKTLWLTDIAQVGPAPGEPPSAWFTAAQTTALVLDTVGAHDADPDAHPALRALIGADGSGAVTRDEFAAHLQSADPHPNLRTTRSLTLLFENGLA